MVPVDAQHSRSANVSGQSLAVNNRLADQMWHMAWEFEDWLTADKWTVESSKYMNDYGIAFNK